MFSDAFARVYGVLSEAKNRREQLALDQQIQPLRVQTLGAQLQEINENVRQLKTLNDLLDKGLKEGENQQASLDDAHAAIQEATTPRERADALAQAFTADPETFGFPSGFASNALAPKADWSALQQAVGSGFSAPPSVPSMSPSLGGGPPTGSLWAAAALNAVPRGLASGASALGDVLGADATDLLRRQLLTEAGLHLGVGSGASAPSTIGATADAVDAWSAALSKAGVAAANEAPVLGIGTEVPIMGNAGELGAAADAMLPSALRGLGSLLTKASPWIGAAGIPFMARDILAAPGANAAQAQRYASAWEANPALFSGSDTVLLPSGHILKRNKKTGKVTVTMRQLEK